MEAATLHPLEAVLHRNDAAEVHRPLHDQAVLRRAHRLLLRHASFLHHVTHAYRSHRDSGDHRPAAQMRSGLPVTPFVVADCGHMSHYHDRVLEAQAK